MKRFLIRVGLTLLLVVLLHAATLLLFGNGKADGFYLRFVASPPSSMILGNSRAAQAIVPSLLDSIIRRTVPAHKATLNYSFTLSTSPYGYYYFESVRRKIADNATDGLFILAVDPWSISR